MRAASNPYSMSLLERRGNRFSLGLRRVDFAIASSRDGFHDTSAILFRMLGGEGFTDSGSEVRRQQLEGLALVFNVVLQQLSLVIAGQRDLGGAVDLRVSRI